MTTLKTNDQLIKMIVNWRKTWTRMVLAWSGYRTSNCTIHILVFISVCFILHKINLNTLSKLHLIGGCKQLLQKKQTNMPNEKYKEVSSVKKNFITEKNKLFRGLWDYMLTRFNSLLLKQYGKIIQIFCYMKKNILILQIFCLHKEKYFWSYKFSVYMKKNIPVMI